MNIFNKIHIDLIHPDIVQEFFSMENFQNYQKSNVEIEVLKRGMGEGLMLSEGKTWKMKRKDLNSVFNFDFFKSLTFRIAEIADSSLDTLERKLRMENITFTTIPRNFLQV